MKRTTKTKALASKVMPTGRPIAAMQRLPRPQTDFQALDAVMQRWGDMRGTAAVMLCMLDGDPDEAAVETMRRHLGTDIDAMSAALDVAWERLVQSRHDRAEGGVDAAA
jgi:hypothetical protein